jgi:hypothetical protein
MRLARKLRERMLAKKCPKDPISANARRRLISESGKASRVRHLMRRETLRVLAGTGDVWKLIEYVDHYNLLRMRGIL